MSQVERAGLEFFDSGKEIVLTLGRMADAARSRDLDALASFYSPGFHGHRLGLTDLVLADDRDGVMIYRFRSEGPAPDTQAAVDEWRD